ncbi:unnamed protein product [Adineta ricciae]|uniref:Uncharacterized protein n=2 Tax=Adineta ricciae TaxID=249248 RepID=A0A813W636_ADIRI|nr:unnamed protein product [Adineta ricciae]
MHLLRRPLPPRLRPLLLSDISNGSEILSPLSSASGSPNSSARSSRPSSHTRSPRLLPPLSEEDRHHSNPAIESRQNEPSADNQLTVAMKDKETPDQDDDESDESEDEREKILRERNERKLLTPLKPREYSHFNKLQRSVTTAKQRSLLRTPKHRGPPALPARRTRTFCDIKSHFTHITDDESYNVANRFTFNDFILHSSGSNTRSYEETAVRKAFLSKYTYKQVCEMIAERVWADRREGGQIHIQTLVPDIEPFQNRVPMHQIVAEMALVLRQHMSHIIGSQLKMNIRTLPSWRQKEGAHTEILLYEKENKKESHAELEETDDSFEYKRDTGAQIAILDSLIKNGTHLDLRAFTLEYLPDISLMYITLVAIDLSYNCFQTIPEELFECTKLEHLYLRHNPISSIGSGMNKLQTLVFLDMAFCQLTGSLTENLFGLVNLRHLDISYNLVQNIPTGIANLRNLRQLLCDGNELNHFPASTIGMTNLRLVTAKNTWLLPPLAMVENSTKPQKLLELTTSRLSQLHWKELFHKIPDSSKTLLANAQLCDTCSNLRIGHGFRKIIICENLFGIKLLPVLFVSCTPECIQQFLSDKAYNRKKMKLITHNMLTSNILKGVTKGFPLKIKNAKFETVSVDYNRDFITRILQRIEYDALRSAIKDLGLNETLPESLSDSMQDDEEFLKIMHRVLLEYEIEEGELICPETGRSFPISKDMNLGSMNDHSLLGKVETSSAKRENARRMLPLYSFDMLPEYLQFNPYIRTGYRHGLTFKGCLVSLLYVNNESVNVWSHLIGAGLFIYFFFHNICKAQVFPSITKTTDYYFILFYTICVIACMLCSVNFHLFNCISPRASAHFLKLDLCGIGCAILGCYICGLHLTFECFQNWRLRYETMIIGVIIIAVIYYIHGVKRYITQNNHVALFIVISLSGFIPSLHWYYLEGGWSNPFIRHFFPKILILYGILTIGVFAYLTKFPERLFPGYFDILFSSHQIWHFATLAAFIWWYHNSIELMHYRLINPCDTQFE